MDQTSANADPSATSGPVGTSGAVDKPWERSWSIEEMRKNASNWSLAGDAGLMNYLQQFSQKMIERTHDIEKQVNGLVHEAKLTGVRLNNSFNDFIMLANTQFVENRVYDEDVTQEGADKTEQAKPDDQEKSREQRETELIPKVTEAINLGINVIDASFEKLDIKVAYSDSEDDDDETPYKTDPILEAKDPYLHRSLPHLIGTSEFMTEDDIGLVDIPSEDEGESDHGGYSESESEAESDTEKKQHKDDSDSDSETGDSEYTDDSQDEDDQSEGDLFGETKPKKKSKEDIFGSSSEEESEESDDEPTPEDTGPRDFTSELAAKLGGGPPPMSGSDSEEEPAPKPKETKKAEKSKSSKHDKHERRESKSKHHKKSKPPDDDDLFGPPPMEDEDSPFGRGGGLFSTSTSLFDDDEGGGGGLFDDVDEKPKATKTKRKSKPAVEVEEDEEEPAPVKKEVKKTKSGKNVPAGGVSLFADQDPDDLFAEAAPRKASSGGGGGLFDDDDDLFAEPAPPKAQPATSQPQQKKPASKPVDLFADDNEDLFAEVTNKKPTTVAHVSDQISNSAQRDLQDDQDIDDTQQEEPPAKPKAKKHEKKLPPGAVSMFGGAPNPFSALKKKQESDEDDDDWSDEEEDSKPSVPAPVRVLPPGANDKQSESGTSSNSNSLFAEEQQEASVPKPTSKKPSKPSLYDDLQDEQDDLFSASAAKPKQDNKPPVKGRSSSLLFGEDDEEDLFAASKPVEKKKPVGGVALFGGKDMFADKKKETVEEKHPEVSPPVSPRKNTVSMFDDDDEDADGDLFAAESKPQPPPLQDKQEDRKRSKSRSLFEDEDILFGGPSEDNPNVDLFGTRSPLKTPKEAPAASKPVVKPAPSKKKADVPDLFGDDKEDDLFASSSTVKKSVPKPGKPETVKATPVASPSTGSDPLGLGGDDLFSKPAKPKPQTKKPTKPEPVKIKGATLNESSSDPLGLDDGGDDLFAKAPPKKPEQQTVTGVTNGESNSDPLGLDGDDADDLFSKPPPKQAEPEVIKPKKPAGAVSMFGGLDPSSLIKKRPPSPDSQLDEAAAAPLSGAPTKTPPSDKDENQAAEEPIAKPWAPKPFNPMANASAKPFTANSAPKPFSPVANVTPKPFSPAANTTPKPFEPAANAKPKPFNPTENAKPKPFGVGKLQAGLVIDPTALLPGAAPPVKDVEPAAVGFDEPAQVETLQSAAKTLRDRAKIQTKRRPPSRAARQRAAQTVSDQLDSRATPAPAPSADPLRKQNTVKPVNKDTDDIFNKPPVKKVEKPPANKHDIDDIFGDVKVPPPKPATKISKPPPAQKDKDIFEEKVAPPLEKTKPVVSNDENIFSESRIPPPDDKPTKPKTVVNDMDDIFGDTIEPPRVNKPKSSKPSRTVDMFGNDDMLDDDRVPPPLPNLSDGEDDYGQFSSSVKTSVPQDDFDELFSATSSISSKSTGNLPPDLDDIFGDSTVLTQPSSKKKESKTKKKEPASESHKAEPSIPDDDIFADSIITKPKEEKAAPAEPVLEPEKPVPPPIQDDDDIFSEANLVKSKKTEKSDENATKTKSKKPKKAVTKDEDLFNDDTNIFDDLPAAKPKEKKTKKKAAKKSVFKDDVDDIFADTTSKPKTKKSSKKAAPGGAGTDIFDGDSPNIFDDPLSAM